MFVTEQWWCTWCIDSFREYENGYFQVRPFHWRSGVVVFFVVLIILFCVVHCLLTNLLDWFLILFFFHVLFFLPISVLTLLSGPGSTVGGLHLDETVPSIFVTLNDNIKVFSPMKPTVVMKEFAIHGFPSTSLTSVTGVSQPCHHYIGTTDGTVTLVHFSNYAKGNGACKYRQDDQEEELWMNQERYDGESEIWWLGD